VTGQRRPPGYGRTLDDPLQLAVPRRLPGGVWGQVPLGGVFSFDQNGSPIDPATGLPAAVVVLDVSNDLRSLQAQTEWPIPTRWELQFGVSIGPDTASGTGATWTGGPATASFFGTLDTSIESASVSQQLVFNNGIGVYPFTAAQTGVAGLGVTFPVIAQQVRVRFGGIVLVQDPALALGVTTTWRWSISTMVGLTAPAIT